MTNMTLSDGSAWQLREVQCPKLEKEVHVSVWCKHRLRILQMPRYRKAGQANEMIVTDTRRMAQTSIMQIHAAAQDEHSNLLIQINTIHRPARYSITASAAPPPASGPQHHRPCD